MDNEEFELEEKLLNESNHILESVCLEEELVIDDLYERVRRR